MNGGRHVFIVMAIFAIASGFAFVTLDSISLGATSSPSNVIANVTVSNTCFISAQSSFGFGDVLPSLNYDTNVPVTVTDNGGNAAGIIFIAGTGGSGLDIGYWTGTGANTMPVGQTLWDSTPDPSYIGNALANSLASTGITLAAPNSVSPSTSANVFFGIGVPPGTAPGTYTQNIILQNYCSPITANTNIIANAVVQGTCFISLSTNAISFGTLYPSLNYNTNVVVTDSNNGGNEPATILVQGTAWQGPGANTIPVGNTLYDSTLDPSYIGNALTASPTSTGIVIAAPNSIVTSESANVFFGLGVPSNTAAGAYTQNIVLENTC